MFEGNIVGEEEEEDVAGKILGAVAIGLGNAIGIRACMLREGETRLRMHGKNAGPRQRSDTHSSGEDEVCVVLYMIGRYRWGGGGEWFNAVGRVHNSYAVGRIPRFN